MEDNLKNTFFEIAELSKEANALHDCDLESVFGEINKLFNELLNQN